MSVASWKPADLPEKASAMLSTLTQALYDKVSRQTHPKHQLLLEPGLYRCIWQGSWVHIAVIRRVFIFN